MTVLDLSDPVWRAAEEADLDNGVVHALPAPEATTWAPISLNDILAGDYQPPVPTMLARTDGRCLLYPERSHSISAEPEALKTWLALGASAEQLTAGNPVLYIDFEGSAAEIIGRLRALGINPEIIGQLFIYVRPDEPLADRALADLDLALERKPLLTVIDGVTEAFNVQGLSPLDNSDVATWLEVLPRRIMRAGSSPLALDHVVKDREQRGRYAIGAQHKLAGVDVAYSMHVVEPFGRGHDGVVTIKVQKDRPGGIREFAQDGVVATLRATSHDDGRVSLSLEPPERRAGDFRPTHVMQKLSEAVEAEAGLSTRDLRASVTGKNDVKDLALRLLIAEGYIDARKDGSAIRHYSLKSYRENQDVPRAPDVPEACPGTPAEDRAPCPHPLRGARPGTVEQHAQEQDDRARAEELHARHRGGDQ